MTRYRKWLLLGCASILVVFMLTIAVRGLTRQIAVKRLHMDNAFTRMILIGEEGLQRIPKTVQEMKTIDWEALYPFKQQENMECGIKSTVPETSLPNRIKGKITSVEEKIDKWTNLYLVGYQSIVEMAKAYDTLLHWDLVKRNIYGTVEICDDGYLINYMDYEDVGEDIFAVTDLYAYCQKNNIPFLYVQAPYKVSSEEINGKLDFSNQKMDELLKGLRENHIPYLDIRENIKAENLPHRHLFYRTDLHWKSQTGFWVAGLIARRLNADFGFDIDTKLLDKAAFDTVVYQDRFLGTEGRYVTLARTKPEDITLFYPKYPTSFRFMIPDKKLDITGDFSVVYDMQELEKEDFYNADAYSVFCYGQNPLTIQQNNNQSSNGKRILFINDSYARCVIPFLGLCVKEVSYIYPRSFTGSIKGYIARTKPDIVILLYYPGNLGKIDWSTHKALFDFR